MLNPNIQKAAHIHNNVENIDINNNRVVQKYTQQILVDSRMYVLLSNTMFYFK